MPTVVKLTVGKKTLEEAPGETVTCRLQLQRTSNFPGPMNLSLLNQEWADSIPKSLAFAAGQTELSVPLQIPDRLEEQSTSLTFRATGEMQDGTPLISQATVTLNIDRK